MVKKTTRRNCNYCNVVKSPKIDVLAQFVWTDRWCDRGHMVYEPSLARRTTGHTMESLGLGRRCITELSFPVSEKWVPASIRFSALAYRSCPSEKITRFRLCFLRKEHLWSKKPALHYTSCDVIYSLRILTWFTVSSPTPNSSSYPIGQSLNL